LSAEEREEYERWLTPPSRWALGSQWIGSALFTLVGGLVILEQWFVWFAWSSQLFRGWGLALGIAVVLGQILNMFNPFAKEDTSCQI
jgi:predicted phage tail protein